MARGPAIGDGEEGRRAYRIGRGGARRRAALRGGSPSGIRAGGRRVSVCIHTREARRVAYFCGYTCGAEEAGVLVHVEGHAADGVGLEHACSEVVDEAERGEDEGGGAGEL